MATGFVEVKLIESLFLIKTQKVYLNWNDYRCTFVCISKGFIHIIKYYSDVYIM